MTFQSNRITSKKITILKQRFFILSVKKAKIKIKNMEEKDFSIFITCINEISLYIININNISFDLI